jgi:hypothetical protein
MVVELGSGFLFSSRGSLLFALLREHAGGFAQSSGISNQFLRGSPDFS